MIEEGTESNYDKGARIEREARDILTPFFHVERVGKGSLGHDMFGVGDLMCMSPDRKPKLVQVKATNGKHGCGFNKTRYRDRARKVVPLFYVQFEVWVRIDYYGWKMYWLGDDGFELRHDIETCNVRDVISVLRNKAEDGTIL